MDAQLQQQYVDCIIEAYPNLVIETIEPNSDGQNNDVLIINDALIFRFPRHPHALEQLHLETAILRGIQSYVTLSVPVPIYVNVDTGEDTGFFMGYRKIAGSPLWRNEFLQIRNRRVLSDWARQIAMFLKSLHEVPVIGTIDADLPIYDTHLEWEEMYAAIQDSLFPQMRPEAQDWVSGQFEQFLSGPSSFDYVPTLRHGDFGPSNILYDQNTLTITGVIDFASAGLGDRAIDFAGLRSGFGEDFLRRVARHYPINRAMMKRIIFYQSTFALQEALYGFDNNDQEAFENGMEDYV